ncbi:MAG: NTP transferase domain-containing protein [Chloroflexi bacterium]|nr:NTP transferase domain-containing protein [Chloroflexota bacterium]
MTDWGLRATAPTLVALAAGLGSRFGGGSAKQVAGLGPGGESLLDYAVHDALAAGFGRLICVIRPGMRPDFEAALGARLGRHIRLDYAYQRQDDLPPGFASLAARTRPWGTGQAVWACRELIDGPFAVINADDFYGRASFQLLARALAAAADGPDAAAAAAPGSRAAAPVADWQLVVFALARTLSPQGGVSRGVCQIDAAGWLRGITERAGIARGDDGRIRAADGLAPAELAPETPVSMNLWGFTPAVFDVLADSFTRFLARGPAETAELYLPTAVAEALAAGSARVRALPSPAAWLGLTHPDDAARVRAGLQAMAAAGDYLTPLWP